MDPSTPTPKSPSPLQPGALPSVLVACRVRPHVARADGEADWGDPESVLQLDMPARTARTRDPSSGRALGFGPFDALFGPDSTQEAVFEALGRPMVEAALNGVNATILAYGQTGSGKTHTMQGSPRGGPGGAGITPRVVEGIFAGISGAADTWEFMVRVSYVEIYLERVRDLLNPSASNLTIRQDEERGVYVEGVVEEYVGGAEELMELVKVGDVHRAVGATGMNEASSRSHSILTIQVLARDTVSGSARTSRLCLVDNQTTNCHIEVRAFDMSELRL
jgi:kinesin family protein 5